ncbi:MAG: ABC transporter permease, partial [Lysinibacillus fusiformis]|nr:ABC transporter permease [Lysinibacillus fusiformis]
IVNAIRALLYEGSVGNDIWLALFWCIGIMVIAYIFAIKQFKRQLS